MGRPKCQGFCIATAVSPPDMDVSLEEHPGMTVLFERIVRIQSIRQSAFAQQVVRCYLAQQFFLFGEI